MVHPDPLGMPPQGGPALSRAASESLTRRRRGRNLALLMALLALVVLLYFVAIAKMSHHNPNDTVTPAVRTPR